MERHAAATLNGYAHCEEMILMDSYVVERRIRCPFCGEAMTIFVDASAGSQSYIEDCQICCQPMQISFDAEEGELLSLRVDCAA